MTGARILFYFNSVNRLKRLWSVHRYGGLIWCSLLWAPLYMKRHYAFTVFTVFTSKDGLQLQRETHFVDWNSGNREDDFDSANLRSYRKKWTVLPRILHRGETRRGRRKRRWRQKNRFWYYSGPGRYALKKHSNALEVLLKFILQLRIQGTVLWIGFSKNH